MKQKQTFKLETPRVVRVSLHSNKKNGDKSRRNGKTKKFWGQPWKGEVPEDRAASRGKEK